LKVALYARVSLTEDAKEFTKDGCLIKNKRFQDPENQLQPLRDWAKALGYEVVEEYVDKKSGADANRPRFRKMLQDASMRRFNGILIWKLDRFSREGIVPTISYIKRLRDRGVFLKSLSDSWIDTENEGVTDIIMAVMAYASAEERKNISQRTKAGIARLKRIGQWKGGRPRKIKGGAS